MLPRDAALDEVWLLPAALPPHKLSRERAPGKHRLAMLELALAGHEQLRASDLEIERGGVSYTVETLAAIGRLHPAAELFVLMGADSLRDLPTWREPARICELALPAVVRRGGSPEPDFSVLTPLVSPERLSAILRASRDAGNRTLQHRPPPPGRRWSESALPHAAGRGKIHRDPGFVSRHGKVPSPSGRGLG